MDFDKLGELVEEELHAIVHTKGQHKKTTEHMINARMRILAKVLARVADRLAGGGESEEEILSELSELLWRIPDTDES